MAHTDGISQAALQRVAANLSTFLSDVDDNGQFALAFDQDGSPSLAAPALELGESLPLYTLKTSAIQSFTHEPKDLLELVTHGDQWHHQVRVGGKDKAFAISRLADMNRGDASVEQVTTSALAEKIHSAIDRIEKENGGETDVLVRLLRVPSSRIYALWLIDEAAHRSRVFIIDNGLSSLPLEEGQMLDSSEFLGILSRSRTRKGII
jgi:hypothetical protein